MEKIKVLFVCVHNNVRSQMGEAFLNQLAGDRLEPESLGSEPTAVNPLAVEVMREVGFDFKRPSWLRAKNNKSEPCEKLTYQKINEYLTLP